MLYDILGRFCWFVSVEYCSRDIVIWVLELGGVLILLFSFLFKKYKFFVVMVEYCRIIMIKILVDIVRSFGNFFIIFVLFI